jgi:hypothetical protein
MFNFLPLSAKPLQFADNVSIIEIKNFRFLDGARTINCSLQISVHGGDGNAMGWGKIVKNS